MGENAVVNIVSFRWPDELGETLSESHKKGRYYTPHGLRLSWPLVTKRKFVYTQYKVNITVEHSLEQTNISAGRQK